MTISVERSQDILKLLAVGLLQEENKNRRTSDQINIYIKQAWEYICLLTYLHDFEVPERVSDLAIYLHEPVENWPVLGEHCLQLGLSGSILEDNALSPQFRALGEGIARSYKPNLALEDSHFRKLFDECRLVNDAKSYTAIRYFLNKNPYHYDFYAIENPAWNESFNKLVSRCYERIPQACIRGTGKQRYIVTCPHCAWPLLWNQLGEARCHEDGACAEIYQLGDYSDYEEHRQPYQDGMIRTKEGIQRFVVAPEVSLIQVYETLKSQNFIQAELYPNLDSYDLLLILPNGKRWAVDLKDWKSAVTLAVGLRENTFRFLPEWDSAFYVFPDYRANAAYLNEFKNYWIPQHSVEFISQSQFLEIVRGMVR